MDDVSKQLPTSTEKVTKVGLRSKDYDVRKLWSNQKEILRLLASGIYTPQEVADICKVHVSTVYRLAKSEYGQQFISMIEGAADNDAMEMVSRIQSLAPIALSIQTDMMLDLDIDPKLRDKIADKIIDRAGYSPTTKVDMRVNKGLNKNEIDNIIDRARELRELEKANMEEAVYEEEDK